MRGGVLGHDGGWSQVPAETWASRLEGPQLPWKGDRGQGNWSGQQKAGSSPAQGLGGVSKAGPDYGRRGWGESPPVRGPADSGCGLSYLLSSLPCPHPKSLFATPSRTHRSNACIKARFLRAHRVALGLWAQSFVLWLTIPSCFHLSA